MTKRLSTYVNLRKEYELSISCKIWRAYWRGTKNRIKYQSGTLVQGYVKQGELKYTLLNNPMEQGVIV